MAQFTTIFISTDKRFLPSDRSIEESVAFLDDVYHGYYPIKTQKHLVPRFIESGADFDRFVCPGCAAVVIQHHWQDWWCSGSLSNYGGEDHVVKVPCCSAEFTLDQFDFGHRAGFACFQINVEGAGEGVAPNQQQIQQLEVLLGCRVRRIIDVMD
jgi:hypothetical protein